MQYYTGQILSQGFPEVWGQQHLTNAKKKQKAALATSLQVACGALAITTFANLSIPVKSQWKTLMEDSLSPGKPQVHQ